MTEEEEEEEDDNDDDDHKQNVTEAEERTPESRFGRGGRSLFGKSGLSIH